MALEVLVPWIFALAIERDIRIGPSHPMLRGFFRGPRTQDRPLDNRNGADIFMEASDRSRHFVIHRCVLSNAISSYPQTGVVIDPFIGAP